MGVGTRIVTTADKAMGSSQKRFRCGRDNRDSNADMATNKPAKPLWGRLRRGQARVTAVESPPLLIRLWSISEDASAQDKANRRPSECRSYVQGGRVAAKTPM